MPTDLTARRVPLLPLAGLVLALLTVVAAIFAGVGQEDANRWIIHTVQVESRIGSVLEAARNVESAHRGYLLTAKPSFLTDLSTARGNLSERVDELGQLSADNPVQQRAIARLRPIIIAKNAFAQDAVDLVVAGRRDEAIRLIERGRGRALMQAIEQSLAAMKATEDKLLTQRNAAAARIVYWLAYGQIIAIILLIGVALVTLRDAGRRYTAMVEARDEARASAEVIRQEMERRENAEGQVRQLQKMESIGQLTGGIAHDFNNMLAIVIGSLDMAQRRMADPAKLGKCLDNAREGAERAAALTSRLLAFSRQQPLAPVAIDANKMVSGMSELLRRTLGEQIAVETVLAGGLWRTYADASQVENALLNLAVNARDAIAATGAEGGRLTIETCNAHLDDEYARTRNEVEPGQYVLICVTDTGTGMPPEVIERAFDPFFTTKEVGKGTGLGLSQVFGFVKQSGGHVAIYSEQGQGTTVKLYLPRFSGPVTDAVVPAVSGALPEGRSDEIILVVEDEQRVRHFSVDALRELGYTALSAGNGAEALVLLAEQPSISLLFTDIVMPQMNGRRLADEAHAIRPDLPVLFTTGYTRNAVVHNGLLDAGVAFLPKPFTIAQLAWKVRDVLDGAGINRPI